MAARPIPPNQLGLCDISANGLCSIQIGGTESLQVKFFSTLDGRIRLTPYPTTSYASKLLKEAQEFRILGPLPKIIEGVLAVVVGDDVAFVQQSSGIWKATHLEDGAALVGAPVTSPSVTLITEPDMSGYDEPDPYEIPPEQLRRRWSSRVRGPKGEWVSGGSRPRVKPSGGPGGGRHR